MSASMAEVLRMHYPMPLNDGGFMCASFDCNVVHTGVLQAIEHQADVLAANGYGKLEGASREIKFLRGERKTLGKELDFFERQGHSTVNIKYLRRFLGRRPE